MVTETLRKKVEKLCGEIEYHNYRYYFLDRPEISDAEYDHLVRELEKIEEEYPELRSSRSPTQGLGAHMRYLLKMMKVIGKNEPNFALTGKIAEKIRQRIEPFSDVYFNSLIFLSVREIIRQDISGKVIGVTGDGPFQQQHLEELIEKLGAIIDNVKIDWSEQEYVIIGREGFDQDYLRDSVKQDINIKYFSQEDFINYLLFEVETDYFRQDKRVENHPGLSFLSSIGFMWPSIFSEPGGGDLEGIEEWEKESILKKKYRYNVQWETTVSERRKSLRAAIKGLGLEKVVNHIAAMVRLNKRRYDDKMEGAVQRWEEDLEWLKKEYYNKGDYRYFWPNY